jgi:hypothetical protein
VVSDNKHAIVLDAQPAPTQRMHPLVQQVLASSPDAATLREVMTMQREWEANEARKAYTRALTALKRNLPAVIARDAVVDYPGKGGRVSYRHASLAGVMDAVIEPLTQHGFSVSWHPARIDRGDVSVSCVLTHAEGHGESCALSAPPDTSGGKSPAQSVASTITLLQRYTLLALLGIATADMQEDPPPEADGQRIDPERNLRAVRAIIRRGRTREAAEAAVGRTVSEWTREDRATLRTWLTASPPPADDWGQAGPVDEPPEDVEPGAEP